MPRKSLTFAHAFGGIYLPAGVHKSKAEFTCRTCMDPRDWTRCAEIITSYDSGTFQCVSCGTYITLESGFETAKVD